MNGVKFYRKQLFHCIGFLVISSFFFAGNHKFVTEGYAIPCMA
jgi:hypothetical protein